MTSLVYCQKKKGIVRIKTSAYRPQSNGKVERLHRVINDIIAKRVAENQLDWHRHLPAALYAIRTCVHTSSKFSPYFLVHGREPKLPIDTLLQPKFKYMGEAYVPTMIQRLHKAFIEVKSNLRESQIKNQHDSNGDLVLPKFEVGDKVLYANLKSEPGLSRKLLKHWQPYFRVLEQTSPVNFMIKHIPTGTVKKVHATHLRKVPGDTDWDKIFTEPADFITAGEESKLHNHESMPSGGAVLGPSNTHIGLRRQPVRACRLSAPLAPSSGSVGGAKRKLDSTEEAEVRAKRCPPVPHSVSRSESGKRKGTNGLSPDVNEGWRNKRRRLYLVQHNDAQSPANKDGKLGWVDSFLHLVGWH